MLGPLKAVIVEDAHNQHLSSHLLWMHLLHDRSHNSQTVQFIAVASGLYVERRALVDAVDNSHRESEGRAMTRLASVEHTCAYLSGGRLCSSKFEHRDYLGVSY